LSGIRVTYSGLISLGVGLVSVFTGIIFTLIVTRQLTPDEFGTWGLLGTLIAYAVIIEPIISYWTTRDIARGGESGKTAIVSSGLFSIGGLLIYIIFAFFIGNQINVENDILLLAMILIPVMFFNRTLIAINLGWKPHAEGYGILAFEFSKIPAALVFVYFLDLGLEGAIFATFSAYLIANIVLLRYAYTKLKTVFNLQFLKKCIKLFWIVIYPSTTTMIMISDVVIFSVITGTVEGLAYWVAAGAIATIVMHGGKISRAVYPKMLEGGKSEYFSENLNWVFYFGIPLVGLSIAFARPALFALNPLYEFAWMIVIILSIRGFLESLMRVFTQAIAGLEKVDVNENSTFRDYIKSKLILIPNVLMIKQVSYIIILVSVLYFFMPNSSQLDLVHYWAIIFLGMQIPFTIFFYLVLRKNITISVDGKSIAKYLIISIAMFGFAHWLMSENLEYNERIFEFLPNLMLFVLIGVGGYLGITYFTDLRTRNLFKSIINEVKNRSTS